MNWRAQTGLHFYYDPAKFDSLRVTLNVNDKPIETVLDLAFANKDFHYTVIKQDVFLTKGRTLKPHLVDGYFNPAPAGAPPKPNEPVTDFTDEKEKQIPAATTENKTYEIGVRTNHVKPGNSTIDGYLRDAKSGEPAIGMHIYSEANRTGRYPISLAIIPSPCRGAGKH